MTETSAIMADARLEISRILMRSGDEIDAALAESSPAGVMEFRDNTRVRARGWL